MTAISNTQIQMPDIVGGYRSGFDYGQAKSEEKRRRPILEQLDQLKLQQAEQATKAGGQKISLNEFALKDSKRKQESADMADFGEGAAWAMNQQDPQGAWEQVLDQYESEGKPVQLYRGRSDLMPMVRDLNNPDYAKQQAVQNNLTNLIKTMPQSMQAQATALGQASPQALYKAAGEGMFKGDTTGQLEALTAELPESQKRAVDAQWKSGNAKGAQKLAADFAKQSEKPKSATELKEDSKAEAAFQDLQITNKKFEEMLKDPVFSESVGPIDQYTADIGAAFGSKSGVMKKKAERAVRGLVRGLVSSFPGSLSEKELEALESEMPKTSDSVEVWADWFENDFTPSYKLAMSKSGRDPSTSPAIDDLVNKYAD